MTLKTIIIISTIAIYAVIWSIGCSPMAVLAHETLGYVGIDSQIALVDVDGKESYGHAYVIIGGGASDRAALPWNVSSG